MSEHGDKQRTTVQARAVCAWLDGLSRDDNPYTIRTVTGKRWAKCWLQAYDAASHGVVCDACKKWLSRERGYHFEYSNGFNYFLCVKCKITDVKPPNVEKVAVH